MQLCVIVGNIGTATAPLEIITHKMGLFFQGILYTFRDNVYLITGYLTLLTNSNQKSLKVFRLKAAILGL